jgi:UDP-3-O-[3-hydroxymyristoyl] N-acetylglucosamine deacetylase/3-hydroxyacyl-[acyl-carrier-protein] dehydratase
MPLQQTVKEPINLQGVGLHTGVQTTVTIKPAPDNTGIIFVRTDLPEQTVIEADIDNVVDLARGTAVGKGDAKIHTLEHIMAAFAGLGIDNATVEVNAPEVPQMDGSALPFVEAIQKAGIEPQAEQREYLTIDEPLDYVDGDLALGVYPSDHFRMTVQIDFHHPALGVQYTTMFSMDDFVKDYAPARTFCFLSEIEQLREKGLIKGGSLDAALVVQDIDLTKEHAEYIKKLFNEQRALKTGDNGFLNSTKPRFPNEPCRHKAIDLLGDLYMLGKPIKAHIFAARPGHASNHEMAKKIRAFIKKKKARAGKPPVGYEEILEILPHRYPFLFVDSVSKIEPGKKIVAHKNVSFNDQFFQGHFPGNPTMPGVLEIEAMAQAGCIMALHGKKNPRGAGVLFMGIDRARFRGIVRPGDILRIEVETLQARATSMRFSGRCFVDDKVVCEAELFAMIGKKGEGN